MTRSEVLTQLSNHFDDGTFLDDLTRRVAIKTESQVPASHPLLRSYLVDEIAPVLRGLDYEVQVFDNPVAGGGPILVARRIEGSDLPTVLTYGHGDVVRGLDDEWADGLDPWKLKRVGDRLYGRGTADNKGQHSVNLAALAAVIDVRGQLGFNSTIMLETSEEIGSPGLKEFCEQNLELLSADVLIASDGPRLDASRPTLYLGTRGAINFDFSLELRDGGHHSGNWGGLLANPGIVMANALASIVDSHGKVLLRDLVPDSIPTSVKKALADCEFEPTTGPTIDHGWGEPGLTTAEKVFGWNTFEILAFRTGNPDNPVNAIPPRATAACQIRYTVDTDPKTFLPAIRRHLDDNGFGQIEVSETYEGVSWAATRMDPDHPWVKWVADSVERSLGIRPALLPNLGGSLPNDVFAHTLGLATIWVPHSYSACSQHAPDEHALVEVLAEGLQMMGGIFWDMGESPVPHEYSV
ncbi:MAG: M20 family metallopeptidase [Acidimicrobiales bacterium]